MFQPIHVPRRRLMTPAFPRLSLRSHHAAPATPLRAGVLAAWACCAALAAQAQTAPDAGSLLRESQQPPPRIPELPPVAQPKLLQDTGVKVLVKRFEVEGSTRFSAAELQPLFTDLVGQELGFAQLQAAADRVATRYRQAGVHATAYLPAQGLKDGVVRIVVVEGRFGRLRVDAGVAAGMEAGKADRALPTALVERMLAAGQTRGEMLDAAQLERATLIANDVPGVRVSSLLTAGEAPGETDVVLKIDARPFVSGAATLDNQDARATGATKLGVAATLAGPGGFGDQTQLSGNLTEGKQYLRAGYELPLAANGWRAGVNASAMHYELRGAFAASGAKGQATTYAASSGYPLVRSAERNLYATGSVEHRHLVNDANAGNLSDKTTLAANLGVNGDATDEWLGGGAMIGGATLTAGRLNLGGNPADLAADDAGPRRNGHYAKLAANLGRLQRTSANGSLWISASGQTANKNLDSGEQFSIGGPNAVRAYPSIEGSGDHGWLASIEYRHRLNDALQLSAFYDHGQVTREHAPVATAVPSTVPNHYALKGAGIGVEWNVAQRATLRALVANRIGHNPAAGANGQDSDGTKRSPRVWLSLAVPF